MTGYPAPWVRTLFTTILVVVMIAAVYVIVRLDNPMPVPACHGITPASLEQNPALAERCQP